MTERVFAEGLTGQVAVVTGGGQGIGREFCRALAAQGCMVAIADINRGACDSVADELGVGAEAFEVDVSKTASVAKLVEDVEDQLGPASILVNNAAMFSSLEMKPFYECSDEEWESVISVNVGGVFRCCRAFAPGFIQRGYGRMINIGSGAAKMGRPDYLHYIASKGAVEAMSRSMARELGGHGITVNTICPGAIFTEIPRATVTDAQKSVILGTQCIDRPGTPADIVSTLIHIASPASGFVTGQSFLVDGGVVHGG